VTQLYPQAPGTSFGRLLRPAWVAVGLIPLVTTWGSLTSHLSLMPTSRANGSTHRGWSSSTPRHRVQVLVAFNDMGVVQLYPQAPGTRSGRLLRPGGGPAIPPGTWYKFWSPSTTCVGCSWTYFPGHHMGKADHSPPSNADVKSERSNTSSRLYTLNDVYSTTLPS